MQTLTEINAAETARRVRARDYEDAKNAVENLQRRVSKLSSSSDADTSVRLRRMIEDAAALPENVIGSIGGLIPVSGVARTLIGALAGDALRTVESRDEKRRAALKATREELKRAESHLATFTE